MNALHKHVGGRDNLAAGTDVEHRSVVTDTDDNRIGTAARLGVDPLDEAEFADVFNFHGKSSEN
jgi:hypothetical protein